MAMQQNMGKRDLEESAVWGARAVLGEIRRREHLEIALRDTMEGLNRISAQGASLRLQFAAQVIDEWGYNCLSGCVPWVMNQIGRLCGCHPLSAFGASLAHLAGSVSSAAVQHLSGATETSDPEAWELRADSDWLCGLVAAPLLHALSGGPHRDRLSQASAALTAVLQQSVDHANVPAVISMANKCMVSLAKHAANTLMNGIARGVLNACAKASRSSEWRTRLGAARVLEVLGAVLSPLMTPGTVSPDPGGGELLGPHKSKVVAVLKDLRYDKIASVRKAATQALEPWSRVASSPVLLAENENKENEAGGGQTEPEPVVEIETAPRAFAAPPERPPSRSKGAKGGDPLDAPLVVQAKAARKRWSLSSSAGAGGDPEVRREGRAAARRRVERKGFASFLSPERRNALGPNFGIQIFEGPKASASPETGGSPPIPLGKKPGDYFPQRQDQEGGVGREGEAEEAPSSEVSASAFRDLPPQRTSPPAAAPRNEPPSPSLAGASASPPSPTRAVIGQQSREGSPGAFDRVCAWVDGVSASPGGTVGFGVQITTAGGGTSSPARGGSGPPAPPALRWSTSPSATRPSENLGGFAVYDNPTAARTPDTASSFAAGAQQEAYDHTYHLIHGNAAARGRSSTGFESRSWWGSPAGPGWQPLAFDSAQGAFQIPDSLPRSPIGSPGRRGLSLGSASPLWQAEASVSRNQRSDSWSRGSPPDEARGIQGPAVLRTEPSDRPTVAAAQERVIHASPPSAPRPRHLSFSEAADAADIAYASLGRGSPVTARLPTSDAFCMFDMSPELPYGSASLSPPPRAWRPPSFPETEAAADAAFEELRRLYPSSPPRPYDSAGGFDLGRPRFQFSSAVDDVGAAFHFAESFQEAPARHVFDDSRYLDPVRHSARWESLAREAKRAPPLRPGPPSERGSAATGASASLRHYHNGVPMDEGEEDGDEWPHSVFRDYSATEDAHELMRKHMADAIVSLSKLQVPDGSPDSPALAARLEGQGGAPPPVDGPLQPSPAGPPEGESLEEVCRRLLSASGFLGPLKDADLREALQKLLRMQTERLKGRYSIAQSRQVAEVKRRNLTAAEAEAEEAMLQRATQVALEEEIQEFIDLGLPLLAAELARPAASF